MPVLDRLIDFTLPAELEAHQPPEARGLRRDQVRLLVTSQGKETHALFADLPDFLATGDLLVANDSGTVPAELTARREDGSELILRLSTHLPSGLWVVEPRHATLRPGERLILPGEGGARIMEPHRGSHRLWEAEIVLPFPPVDYLLAWGRPVRYSYVPQPWPLEYYQTVYHRELGSAEMASAGRPFTWEVIDRLRQKGIAFVTLTLHTGLSSLESHEPPYEEYFRVPPGTAEAVRRTKQAGGRVIAVGTTVVRALESADDGAGSVQPRDGWTDLVITPELGVRVVDGLLTGFHEPKASHLAMLAAIAGREELERAYGAALDAGYLWHEFGDVHLIL